MLPVWGGLYLEGLICGGAYFQNFTVLHNYTYKNEYLPHNTFF